MNQTDNRWSRKILFWTPDGERKGGRPRLRWEGSISEFLQKSFGFNGDCTFAIPIRSLFISGEDAYIQTSGGIVADSQPESEYIEIQRKLGAFKQVLESF